MPEPVAPFAGDRLAKVIARAGLCSRRDAELWIKDGRVVVNGRVIRTPAFNVTANDDVRVDGEQLVARQGTRVWLYHKPIGLVVTEKDPEGRPTIFDTLAQQGLPRVVSIGRLDINTEGLLLLTNDGGLKRVLELPATGWLRRYRVRAFGKISQPQLDGLKDGLEVDGVKYGPIEATLEREQGSNVWLVVSLREGKNREIKNVLAALGLKVNRLIRVSFGPFQLNDLPIGAVEVVKAKVLREQLGKRLADEAGVDFESDLPEPAAIAVVRRASNPNFRAAGPGREPARQRRRDGDFRFAEGPDKPRSARPPRRDEAASDGPPRRIFNPDGTISDFEVKTYGRKPKVEAGAERPTGRGPRRDFGDKPKRDFGDRPPRTDAGSRRSSPARSAGEGDHAKRGGGSDRGRSFSDRPKRTYSDKPGMPSSERPKRSYGDKPPRDAGDRPKRAYAGNSAAGTSERPKRSFGDKPKGDFGDKPKRAYSPRPGAPAGPKRSYGGKPRSAGDRPATGRAPADSKRPRGSGPGGDRPRRPRPPRA